MILSFALRITLEQTIYRNLRYLFFGRLYGDPLWDLEMRMHVLIFHLMVVVCIASLRWYFMEVVQGIFETIKC
jgi:hypothetical protein